MTIAKCECCKRVFRGESDLLEGTSCFKICSDNNLYFECSCNSCIMIPEGKYDWYDPEFFMGKTTKSIFKKIKSLDSLPRVSQDVEKIKKRMEDDGCDSGQLEKLIKKTPPIALNIIEIANSMAQNEKIESLKHAISYLGLVRLRQIVYFAGIRSFTFRTEVFQQDKFWETASLAGLISEYLVKKFVPNDRALQEQAYFTASLANIGKVVAAILFPATTDIVVQIENLDFQTAKIFS